MAAHQHLRPTGLRSALALASALSLSGAAVGATAVAASWVATSVMQAPAARAQGIPGLFEFRWENNRDYRRLYYFITNSGKSQRSEYYLILKPKDRKTAILKLTITLPDYFDSEIEPKNVKLCRMSEGGMLKRTRCLETIPATVEVAKNGKAIEIFPNTPISDKSTIGVYINLFNPSSIGMFQLNAMAQAPGDIPVSTYLGSWIISIDPTNEGS
ncbi:MAG: DUF2808 domain-containing protein [Synechococcaceae cyanobacterium]|nr:DUF2808 domain-containing protein [Synechococcaceae cyanobacterium]